MGGAAVRAEIVERWRTGAAALRRRSPLPRPSRWMWAADAILAFVLAACTVGAAYRRGDGVGPVAPAFVPAPPRLPVPPGVPHVGPLPDGGVGVTQLAGSVEPWLLLLAALTALPLVVRRRFPLSAFWAVIVATLLFNERLSDGDPTLYTFLSCVVAAYSAAVYSPYRARALAGLVVGAALVAALRDENFPSFAPGLVPFLALLAVGLGANAVHIWKQRLTALEEEHEAATRLAVDRERSRIARELHDVVTHNVSVMVIQAGAARKVMDTAPDRAREALLAVEAGGRTAMAELRHVMGLLTMAGDGVERAADAHGGGNADDPDAGAGLAPQPGLAQVPALTDRVRETGVPVELTVTGTPVPLAPGADLAAYRVVQEALTNTVRHAVGSRVRIAIEHVPGAVRIEVSDTGGTSAAPDGLGGGRGLIGLRERLAVYGATLRAGERPTGGFEVRAVIPVQELA
ncbi:signal transduction histidine kinase [Streptomyces sp. 3330]|uniref:sensor histidine kinase n=1 Tax=Streptomyces sp. 3330 TaxID=2817755 RepID=UPI002861240E|nr:histidine kinase [Streptomyces sp. 3330]MDR6974798.1 signal transduction histidine kinase [Streptomyces sp. 3330]